MNIVAIIGNVASEPELRQTEQGRPVCTFRVAVSRPADATTADFFDVVAVERQAEVCREYLAIGRRIAVQGRLRCRVVDLNEQARRMTVELVACRVDLLGPKSPTTNGSDVEQAEVAR